MLWGVGKKSAQRIVLELRSKIEKWEWLQNLDRHQAQSETKRELSESEQLKEDVCPMKSFRLRGRMKINLPPFTLIGATTRAGQLTSPLMGRFGIVFRLEYYQPEDLQMIIVRSAGILKCRIDIEGALEISKRARGTPRVANG